MVDRNGSGGGSIQPGGGPHQDARRSLKRGDTWIKREHLHKSYEPVRAERFLSTCASSSPRCSIRSSAMSKRSWTLNQETRSTERTGHPRPVPSAACTHHRRNDGTT